MPLGTDVLAYVTLSATAPLAGSLEVEVRSDFTLGPDETKKLCIFQVALSTDLLEAGPCVFTASELTGAGFRQYFVRISWNETLIYSPVDPDTREFVMTVETGTPTPTP